MDEMPVLTTTSITGIPFIQSVMDYTSFGLCSQTHFSNTVQKWVFLEKIKKYIIIINTATAIFK